MDTSQLATKDDIKRLEKLIAETELRMTKTLYGALSWVLCVIAALLALAVAILK